MGGIPPFCAKAFVFGCLINSHYTGAFWHLQGYISAFSRGLTLKMAVSCGFSGFLKDFINCSCCLFIKRRKAPGAGRHRPGSWRAGCVGGPLRVCGCGGLGRSGVGSSPAWPCSLGCVARSGVCCLGGFVARRVPPRCGLFGCPPRACCPGGWVRDRLPLGQRLRRSLGGCGFWGVLRRRQLPRRAARSLPSWAFSRRAGAGLGRSVVAPGGRRGLSPVLAVCLWDSVVAPCPRLRAVAARWGACLCARGCLGACLGCCLAPPLAAVRCRGLGARPGWVRARGWCAPPAPSARPPPGGGLPIVLAQRLLY